MAITNSAKKSIRQSKTRTKRNLVYKKQIKGLIKEVRALIAEKKTEEAKKLLPKIYSILDKSAKKGIIKKNNASRRKSRLTKLVGKKAS